MRMETSTIISSICLTENLCLTENRSEGPGDLHLVHRNTHATTTQKLIANIIVNVESGFWNPRIGSTVFSSNPIDIRKKILVPAEKRRVVCKLGNLILAIFRHRYPGMKVRKRKPSTCLATKISNTIETAVAS
jgi:hypothetical protein